MIATTLVIVPDEAGERAVIERLGALEAAFGGPVAPVLAAAGLPERTAAALRAAGIAISTLTAEAALARISEPQAPRRRSGARPAAVLVAADADPGVVRLAAAICGVAPRDLSAAGIAGIDRRAVRENPTAVVLLGPETGADEVIAGLEALHRDGVHAGLIPAGDPVDDRFTVLKFLLPERLPRVDRYAIMAGTDDPRVVRGAPGCISQPDRTDNLAQLQIERDVMVLSGHAFPFDQLLGRALVLCARRGLRGAPTGAERGQLPCFRNGQCFRQARLGRDPAATTGLVGVGEVRASVVMLAGCNHAAFGQSWFDARASLPYQAIQGQPLAVVAATSLSEGRLELNLLGLALLADGAPLGEVVAEINRVRTDVHGRACGLPAGVGPFVLFGNPGLRADTAELPARIPEIAGDGTLSVAVGDLPIDPEYGALLRVPLPPDVRYPSVALTPPGAWCRGIAGERGGVRSLYLWLGPGDGVAPEVLAIEHQTGHPWRCERTALGRFAGELPFWTVFLDSYRAEADRKKLPREVYDKALAALPGALRAVAAGSAGLRCPDGVVEERDAMFDAVLAPAWQHASAMSLALLDCSVEVACQHGTMQFHGWGGAYAPGAAMGRVGRCACGQADVWGQIYDCADRRLAGRALYQCGRCGYVGEDDGRRLVTLAAVPSRVRPAEVLRVRCRLSAPRDEVVQVHAVVVMERWLKEGRVVGGVAREVVDPGNTVELELSVRVPEQLTAGVFPLAVVAVANGALCILRQMIDVGSEEVIRGPGQEEEARR